MNRQLSKGMTLIELMVVVLIIGILAGIAYPGYRQYVMRANRTEAKTELLQLAQVLEKCYTRYNSYKDDDGCDADTDFNTEHYAITAPTQDTSEFVLRATPTGAQATDTCGVLALNNVGQRFERTDQAVVPANKCW